MGAALYAANEAETNAAGPEGSTGTDGESAGDDDVVDAEIVDEGDDSTEGEAR